MQLASSILMIKPRHFGYNSQTALDNSFQSEIEETDIAITERARYEFDIMVDKLRENAIDVWVIEDTDEPIKPDAVFPNNWFCTLPTGELFVFPIKAPNRRIEKREDIIDAIKQEYNVKEFNDFSPKVADDIFLESTGSIVFDHLHKEAYACVSQRTNKEFFESFCEDIHYKPHSFSATIKDGKEIYHTNVMMHIGETYAVLCLEAIDTVKEQIMISNALRKTGRDIIAISYEQMDEYAGNMLQLNNLNGKKITVLSQKAYVALRSEQKFMFNRHTDLVPIDVSTIEKVGGGSVRCMMTEIFLNKKNE